MFTIHFGVPLILETPMPISLYEKAPAVFFFEATMDLQFPPAGEDAGKNHPTGSR